MQEPELESKKIQPLAREILTDFMQIVEQDNRLFFRLKDGKDCLGIIESVNDNFIQFAPEYESTEVWKDYDYEIQNEFDPGEYLIVLIPLQDIDTNNLYYWNEQSYLISAQWSVDRQCWIHSEAIPGSIPLPTDISKPINNNKLLKVVGYWQSDEDIYYPHPRHLVEPGWRESERHKIIAYLRSGHECGYWCGFSDCRFGCFSQSPDKNASELEHREFVDGVTSMGCRDLTDGEWKWPEGLAHYVEKHNICLPDEFVETMQKNSWLVPPKVDFTPLSEVGVSNPYWHWINWAIEYVKKSRNSIC